MNVQLPVKASDRNSSTSDRVNPNSVAMEPKFRIIRGVLSVNHDLQLQVAVVC